MKHSKHHQIDKEKWDRCISASKENIIYAFSWYLDQVSPNWEALILEKNSEYVAVLPLPVQKKYGIVFLQQPLFAQQLGIFSTQNLNQSEFKSFLVLLKKKFKLVSNYSFNISNYQEYKKVFEDVFQIKNLKQHTTHHLSLQREYAQIQKGYKRDTKYRIKQAKQQSFEIFESDDVDVLYHFFEESVFLENGISNKANKTLKDIFLVLKQRELAKLFFIKNNKNDILSGVLFVKSISNYPHLKWIYLFNAANPNIKEKNESRRWFLDKFIEENSPPNKKTINPTVLDFESAQETKVALFYASFGSEEKPFLVLNYNKLPVYIQLIQKIIQFIKGKVQ